MSALLVKDPPSGLCDWLKPEAKFNRRSVNQQILICLEWCMKTYGAARFRNPFGNAHHVSAHNQRGVFFRTFFVDRHLDLRERNDIDFDPTAAEGKLPRKVKHFFFCPV